MAAWMAGVFAASAGGMLICAGLFVTLKMEMRTRERRARAQWDAALAAATGQIGMLEARLAEMEQTLRELQQNACGPAPRPGLNLTSRTQVLRRRRQGEDAGQIAAALGLSRTEVELLLKVDQIAMQRT